MNLMTAIRVKKEKRPLILTCSLCANYDSNREVCKLSAEIRKPSSAEYAATCKEKGDFIRYMQAIPDVFNYYTPDEDVPLKWGLDLSRVPVDPVNKLPMVVYTNRGAERPIPANDSVVLTSDPIFGVPLALTYQGQRQLIYFYGVENAKKEAEKVGVELTVLPEEEGWAGIESERSVYEAQEKAKEVPAEDKFNHLFMQNNEEW